MSGLSWQKEVKQTLHQLQREVDLPPRVAVLGVGHELRQDDAVGLLVAQALRPFVSDSFRAVEAGAAPENVVGVLQRFAPHLLIVLDAASLDAEPGIVQVLNWRDATGVSASTHSLPLRMVLQFVWAETQCRVLLLGIQPSHVGFGTAVSTPIQQAVIDVVNTLTKLLRLDHSKIADL